MSVARGGIVRCVVGALAAAGAAAGGIVAAPGPAAARPAHVRIAVDAPVASAYRAVHVRVTGLPPGDQITITSSAHDHAGMLWEARASFTADPSGTVDLTRQAPTSGTYRGADGMGLVWSMDPVASSGASKSFYFAPPHPEVQSDFPITLCVRDASGHLASATLTRVWMEPGVTHRTFTVAADGVYGDLYLPAPSPGATPRPAVLLFGGSEGGEAERYTAAVLASAGYPALSIAYFDAPGLPGTLTNIPLEYLAGAARILAEQSQVDPAHVLAMGASRGTEAALLLAQYFPDLIHGAIVYAPNSKVNPSFPSGTGTAWTLHGAGLAIGTRIPLDNVSGPVLAIAGTDDAVWDSSLSAHLINTDLNTDGLAYPHEAFVYPLAGHGIDEGVYVPSSLSYTDPASGYTVEFGGTREADAAGQQAAWQKVLALLAWLRRH